MILIKPVLPLLIISFAFLFFIYHRVFVINRIASYAFTSIGRPFCRVKLRLFGPYTVYYGEIRVNELGSPGVECKDMQEQSKIFFSSFIDDTNLSMSIHRVCSN